MMTGWSRLFGWPRQFNWPRPCARALAVALILASPAVALAQGTEEPPLEAPAPVGPPPVYEAELLRLSEVIGALSFLRGLCEADDAAEWPARMQALIEAEGPARAERLAGAYNRGYGAFALTYRSCTPSAQLAIARYLEEGDALSRTIASRYGG